MPARIGTLLFFMAWPAALHIALLAGAQSWMPAITTIALAAALAICAFNRRALAPIACVLAVVAAGLFWFAPAALLFAPSVLINIALAAIFAASLRAGREPVISVFAKLEQGALPPELVRYTRRLTQIWCALFIGMAAVALGLAMFASLAAWSLFSNVVCYALVAFLIAAEYAWRRLRFPHYRHAPFVTFLKNVLNGRFRLLDQRR